MDREELNILVVKATQLVRTTHTQREALERRPVTWADLLANRVQSFIETRLLDTTLKDLDKAIKRGHGDDAFDVFGDRVTVAFAHAQLAEAIRAVRYLEGSK